MGAENGSLFEGAVQFIADGHKKLGKLLNGEPTNRRDFLHGVATGAADLIVGGAAVEACAPAPEKVAAAYKPSEATSTQAAVTPTSVDQHNADLINQMLNDQTSGNKKPAETATPAAQQAATSTSEATATQAPTATEALKSDEEKYGNLVPMNKDYIDPELHCPRDGTNRQWIFTYPVTVEKPAITKHQFGDTTKEVLSVKIGFRTKDQKLHIVPLVAVSQPDEGKLPSTSWACDGGGGTKWGDWSNLTDVLVIGTELKVVLPADPVKIAKPLPSLPDAPYWNNSSYVALTTLFNQDKSHITPQEVKALAKDGTGMWPDRDITLYDVFDGGLTFVQTKDGSTCSQGQ